MESCGIVRSVQSGLINYSDTCQTFGPLSNEAMQLNELFQGFFGCFFQVFSEPALLHISSSTRWSYAAKPAQKLALCGRQSSTEVNPLLCCCLRPVVTYMCISSQIEEIVSTAQFGDLIEFAYPIGYSHWGVYDEDGFVIHFAVAGENCLQQLTYSRQLITEYVYGI